MTGERQFNLPLELKVLDDGTYQATIACLPGAVGRGRTITETELAIAAAMAEELNKLPDDERSIFLELETSPTGPDA